MWEAAVRIMDSTGTSLIYPVEWESGTFARRSVGKNRTQASATNKICRETTLIDSDALPLPEEIASYYETVLQYNRRGARHISMYVINKTND